MKEPKSICLFEDCFLFRNIKIAGEGAAKIRQFQFLTNPLSFAIPDSWNSDVSFVNLAECRDIIDCAFERLKIILKKHNKNTIYVGNNFATRCIDEVKEYITHKVKDIEHNSSTNYTLEELCDKEKQFAMSYGHKKRPSPSPPLIQNTSKYFKKKLFVGAPSSDTLRATEFPFFSDKDFGANGELMFQKDFEWKGTAWPNIPFSYKVEYYKEWCQFRFKQVSQKGSNMVDVIWKEWIETFSKTHSEIVPL